MTLSERTISGQNVRQIVPFLYVSDMERSLHYYVSGLGFTMKKHWIDGGKVRWCCLELGETALMLQEFRQEGHDAWRPEGKLGEGLTIIFICKNAVRFYREIRSRDIQASEPQVRNTMWVTCLSDPDGYRLAFESSTETPEDTRLSEIETTS